MLVVGMGAIAGGVRVQHLTIILSLISSLGVIKIYNESI